VLRIGSITVDPPLVLAPMAGVTDSPFRRIIRDIGGCGLVTMEFISSEAMVRGIGAELGKLLFHPSERPISIQIYGSRPDAMAEAARMVVDSGAELCDINMGCPANKIIRGCAGAALMGNLDLARRIIQAVRSSISIPLTVKLRSGLRAPDYRDLELGRICEEEGVDAVTLHPRTAKQQYRGHADWQRIGMLKQSLTIPVIGNGDVAAPEDAARMITETGCDGVMIGRAALTNPWIFRQTEAHLAGQSFSEASLAERRAQVMRHFDLLAESFSDKNLLHKLKTFTGRYSRGLAGGRKLRCKLSEINDPTWLRDEVERFFDLQLQPIDRR
jgi:nifR3 family TIM-barrel protein